MRRFVGLVILLLFTIPFGISISGCAKKSATVAFCNGGDSGPQVGQLTTITLTPKVYGVSLNYGTIGQSADRDRLQGQHGQRSVLHLWVCRYLPDRRRYSAHHRPHLRWSLEPQLRGRRRRLHLLHRDQQNRDLLGHRQCRRRKQQSIAGLCAPRRYQRGAGCSLNDSSRLYGKRSCD